MTCISITVLCLTTRPDRNLSWCIFVLSGTCYMPEVVFASPGSEVTVYCSIADTRRNATKIRWWLNYLVSVPENQYQVISDHVSAVTWRPSEAGMDVLLCCEKGEKDQCSHSYAKVYTAGLSVGGSLSLARCKHQTSGQYV